MAAKKSTPRRKATVSKGLTGFSDAELNEMNSDEFADRLLHDVSTAPPVLSDKDIAAIESRFPDGPKGAARRAMLFVLQNSGAWLIDNVEKDRETAVAFADIARCGSAYAEELRELAELVDAAATRINVALCVRGDMDSVMQHE